MHWFSPASIMRLVELVYAPDTAEETIQALESLCERIGTGTERSLVVAHGDFCPGNILMHGDAIVVLDFSMIEHGSVFQDLSYCFEHLERNLYRYAERPLIRPRVIRKLQRALLEGYDPATDVSAPLFRLGQIRHAIRIVWHTPAATANERAASWHRCAREIAGRGRPGSVRYQWFRSEEALSRMMR